MHSRHSVQGILRSLRQALWGGEEGVVPEVQHDGNIPPLSRKDNHGEAYRKAVLQGTAGP